MGVWSAFLVDADPSSLERPDLPSPGDHARRITDSRWLAFDGFSIDWDNFPYDEDELDDTHPAMLSRQLGCRGLVMGGSTTAPGLSLYVFDRGRCVRALDSSSGEWFVYGDEVQPWERKVVDDHIPDDVLRGPEPDDYDGEELQCYGPLDQRVIREHVFVSDASLPRDVCEHDLRRMGFEAHVHGQGERVQLRAPRGWFARLFGR